MRKRGAELGDAVRPHVRAELFGRDAEGVGGGKDGHGGGVVERDGLGVAVRELLEHLDDGRVIVPEDVELDEALADGMVIKMRRERVGFHIVRRALDRREIMHVHVARHDHDAARVLSRSRLDAHAAAHHVLDVGASLLHAHVFVVVHGVAVGVLVLKPRDRTRTEHVHLAEEDFGVFVRDGLIVAREVEIDIGDFVAVKSEEHRERDVVPVLDERRAADGAVHGGQVKAAPDGAVRDEFIVLTVFAAIMRRQRVDLGDADHGRDEGRSDRSARADEIAVVVGFLDESLRDDVERGKAVFEDRS